jgi:xylulose-5-phosphate/fructose-6-phosphate phosphoketolase
MAAILTKPTVDNSISAFGLARSTVQGTPLRPEELRQLHAFWCASNYRAARKTPPFRAGI